MNHACTSRLNQRRRRSLPALPYESLEQRHLLAALLNGQEVIEIVDSGETKTFEIEVTTPGKVYVSVSETFNFASDVFVEIRSPSNASIGSGNDNTGLNLEFSAIELGTYQVQVRDVQRFNGFQFRIRTLAISQPYELLEGRDKLLENGEEIITAYPENGLGVYQISVEPTEGVEKNLLLFGTVPNNSNGVDQHFRADLINPNGQFALENRVLRNIIYAGNPGTYTVVVQNEGDASDFQLRNFDFTEPFQPIDGRDAILANGQEQLVQVPAQSIGLVQFDLVEDVPAFVSISPGNDPNNVVQWNLVDPKGVIVEGGTTSNSGITEFAALESGRYTLMVESQNRLEPVEARVRVLSTSSSHQFVAGRDKALSNGERVSATVPARGFNAYSIEMNEQDSLRVLLDTTEPFSTPSVRVIGPGGDTIGVVFSDQFRSEIFVTEAGTYTLLITNDNELPIDIALQPMAFSENLTSFVDNDSFLLDGGEITEVVTPSNRFVFQFEADELDEVELFVKNLSDPFSNQLRLTVFEPSGDEVSLFAFGNSNAGLNEFTASASGVYTGIIESTNSFSGADPATLFSLGLFATAPETPLEVSLLRDEQPASEPQQLSRPDQLSELKFGFNRRVGPWKGDFTMTIGGQSAPYLIFANFGYDPTTRFAAFNLSSNSQQPLPGYYTVAINGGLPRFPVSGQVIQEVFSETFYVAIPGDANLDGTVDVLSDGSALVNNLGVIENATWADGDFDGDGAVDVLSDAAILVANLGSSVTEPGDGETSSTLAMSASTALIVPLNEHDQSSGDIFEPAKVITTPDELTLAGAVDRDAAFAGLLDL